MRCPSVVVNFYIFDFSSETAKRNSTKLDRKQDLNVFYQFCIFRADRKNQMAALASDWLRHFRLLLWNHRTKFNKTWQEARSQRPLPSLCFSGRLQKWPPWPIHLVGCTLYSGARFVALWASCSMVPLPWRMSRLLRQLFWIPLCCVSKTGISTCFPISLFFKELSWN